MELKAHCKSSSKSLPVSLRFPRRGAFSPTEVWMSPKTIISLWYAIYRQAEDCSPTLHALGVSMPCLPGSDLDGKVVIFQTSENSPGNPSTVPNDLLCPVSVLTISSWGKKYQSHLPKEEVRAWEGQLLWVVESGLKANHLLQEHPGPALSIYLDASLSLLSEKAFQQDNCPGPAGISLRSLSRISLIGLDNLKPTGVL